MALTEPEIIVLVILGAITLAIIGILVWFFLVVKKGNSAGESCKSDSDCASGLYCGGGDQCVAGTEGKKTGGSCKLNADCEVGLLCVSGKCTDSVPPLPDPIINSSGNILPVSGENQQNFLPSSHTSLQSFQDQFICVQDDTNIYYLEIPLNGGNSKWVKNKIQIFTYDADSNYLFVRAGTNLIPINIKENGSLCVSSNNAIINIILGSQCNFIIDMHGYFLCSGKDKYFPLAVFEGSLAYDSMIVAGIYVL